MSLRLILGRAGTGKTYFCLQDISEKLKESPDGPPLILLVPEQATFQLERELASKPGLGGIIRAQVLSFRRFAWKVLWEAGGAARVYIGEIGKSMVLRKCLENRGETLKVFGRFSRKTGFCNKLADTLSEIKRYLLTPEQLLGSGEYFKRRKNNILAGKLHDLSLLYSDLEESLASKYLDPDDYLTLFAEKLRESRYLQDAEVWLDGFTGFTPQEYLVLESLLKTVKRVNVALCLDGRELEKPLEEEECFRSSRETYEQLRFLAQKNNVALCEPQLLDKGVPYRFRERRALAHIEKYFFTHPAPEFSDAPQGIKLVAAASRRAEVEGVAREILYLCRTEGFRFREMAVLLRDLTDYSELIKNVFKDYNIPYFMDQKRTMVHHPLVELVRTSLKVVEENWAFDPLFRFLKTDLFCLSRDEVDCLENYVLAHGIKGGAWLEEKRWDFVCRSGLDKVNEMRQDEAELEEINKSRKKVQQYMLPFYWTIKRSSSASEITVGVYDLLVKLGVPEQLDRWYKKAEARGELEEAREHAQAWDAVVSLFEQLTEVLGDEPLSLRDYISVLESGLESLKLGLIPPGLDQVLVASLGRSRIPDMRAVFVLGVNDGEFPARPVDSGILTDQEREELQKTGFRLAPGGRRLLLEEQNLIYTALTRGRSYLWISYFMADEEGKASAPSIVIQRLKELLPRLKETPCQLEPGPGEDPMQFISTPRKSLSYLVNLVRKYKEGDNMHPAWLEVYNWLAAGRDSGEYDYRVLESIFDCNQEKNLPCELGSRIYGKILKTSVSRLEKFQACPFMHFLSCGLGLKERKIFGIEAPDYGQFYHAALKEFAERVQKEDRDWGTINEEDASRITSEIVDDIAPRIQNEILISSARYRYVKKKLERVVRKAVDVLSEHAARSSFRPVGLEMGFGSNEHLPPLRIKIGKENLMEITGRIDRVDAAKEGENNYLRVIDYKSNRAELKLEDIYHGLNLQLLTYLEVCLKNSSRLTSGEAFPGGMFYFRVDSPLLPWKEDLDPKRIKKAVVRELRMKGIVLADTKVVRLMDSKLVSGSSDLIYVTLKKDGSFRSGSPVITQKQFKALRRHLYVTLEEVGRRILNGEVSILPYKKNNFTSCQHCSYRPVCKFDTLLEGNRYRMLASCSDEEIWKLLGKERY